MKNTCRTALSVFVIQFLTFFVAFTHANAENRVALVIGNETYANTSNLYNPKKDAKDIAAALRRLRFEVTELHDISHDKMRKAVISFGRLARRSDMAVIYFAGHGMEIGGENWLIPVDAKLLSDIDVEDEAIGLSYLMSKMRGTRKLSLIILDACRNNPFSSNMSRTTGISRAVSRGFARIEPEENLLVAYAAREGTLADDGKTGENSPYAAALLKHLETPNIDIRIVFGKIRDEVKAKTNKRQTPHTYGSLPGHRILLNTNSEANNIAENAKHLPPAQSRITEKESTPGKNTKLALNGNIQASAKDIEKQSAISQKRISVPVGKYYADAVALSSDGRLIALSDFEWNINVFYVDSGLLAAKFQGHEGRVFSIDFSPKGELLATGSSDGTVRIWSLGQKREIRKFRDNAENRSGDQFLTTRVAFAPDGKYIAYTGRNHTVEIVRIGDSYVVSNYDTQLPARTNSADRDAECKYATSPSPACIRASRAARNRKERDSASRNSAVTPVEDIAFSADGKLIATISHGPDSDIQIFDWKNNKFIDRTNFRTKFGIEPRSLAFSPSKQQLAVIGDKKVGTPVAKDFVALVLYELSPGSKPRINYRAAAPGISLKVDFSSDGRMVALPVEYGFVVYDTENNIEVRKINDNCTHRYVQLAGGWPSLLATDFCDNNGVTILPLNQLK